MTNKLQIFVMLVCSLFFFSCENEETTQPPINNAPARPSSPSPADGVMDISRSPVLSWLSNDPDAGDSVRYDVYFGAASPPTMLSASNLILPSHSLTGLDTNRTYYWKITAKDSKGSSSAGPVWSFRTVIGLPPSGLVAYYPFNGNANDESGSGWNGTVNGALLTPNRFGTLNGAYHFNDNASDSITTDFPGILGKNARTFSFWQKSNISNHSYSLSYGAGIDFQDSAGSIFYIGLQRKSATQGILYADLRFGGIAYSFNDSAGDWHHYCVVVPNKVQPRTEDVIMYIDGVLLTNVFYNAGSVVINTLPGLKFTIGQSDSSTNFGGSIDDIRVYNRALSNSEIQSLYRENGW